MKAIVTLLGLFYDWVAGQRALLTKQFYKAKPIKAAKAWWVLPRTVGASAVSHRWLHITFQTSVWQAPRIPNEPNLANKASNPA
ncbi:MAG: hypothetical protein IPJ90_07960 [Anaerolineaceae bacterium]|nr:hypothetical protein [Anaerolineaceae bacterium]